MKSLKEKLILEMRGDKVFLTYQNRMMCLWVGDGRGSGNTRYFNKFTVKNIKNNKISFDTTEFLTDEIAINDNIVRVIVEVLDKQKKILTSYEDGITKDVYPLNIYIQENFKRENLFERESDGLTYMLVSNTGRKNTIINFFSSLKELKDYASAKFKKV